jgi:hypothetical protein
VMTRRFAFASIAAPGNSMSLIVGRAQPRASAFPH